MTCFKIVASQDRHDVYSPQRTTKSGACKKMGHLSLRIYFWGRQNPLDSVLDIRNYVQTRCECTRKGGHRPNKRRARTNLEYILVSQKSCVEHYPLHKIPPRCEEAFFFGAFNASNPQNSAREIGRSLGFKRYIGLKA